MLRFIVQCGSALKLPSGFRSQVTRMPRIFKIQILKIPFLSDSHHRSRVCFLCHFKGGLGISDKSCDREGLFCWRPWRPWTLLGELRGGEEGRGGGDLLGSDRRLKRCVGRKVDDQGGTPAEGGRQFACL